MRVHIVCRRPHADRVLPRHARYLMQDTGWTLSEHPDPTADLNYFFNYIEWTQHHYGWRETKTAAYFTHMDTANKTKMSWWNKAANWADLHFVISNQKYAQILKKHGRLAIARPPVEREHFRMAAQHFWGPKPTIGLSGYTYKDNRKGEDIVEKLMEHPLGQKFTWRASGRGWPCQTKGYSWQRLPQFFQNLSVFLCASRIEGIPMPPLEALSCGIPIIIPRSVGMLDELPDIPGIYRFAPGNMASILEALEEALTVGKSIDRKALREVTAEYTPENWRNDHIIAFENLFYEAPVIPEVLPDWKTCSGMYTVAFGEQARRCAVRLIKSFKKYMPNVPVALAAETPLGLEDVFIKTPDKDIGGRGAKLRACAATPKAWQYVLYMDADTEVVSDLSPLFQMLNDGWELVICKDMHKYHTVDMMLRPDNAAEFHLTKELLGTGDLMQYNGGLVGFRRNQRVHDFFEKWLYEWRRFAKRDQGALLRALYFKPLRLMVLPNHWNATVRYKLPEGEMAVLHHNMQARRWSGLVYAPTDSEEAWVHVKKWKAKHGDKSPDQVDQ